MEVHLVDGTYELFRHHFAVPSHITDEGIEVAAVRGVLNSMMSLLEQDATHVGIATDQVVESFRNDLFGCDLWLSEVHSRYILYLTISSFRIHIEPGGFIL